MKDVTLVTGASAGLGLVFAQRLAAQKRDLVLVARRKVMDDRLRALAINKAFVGSGLMNKVFAQSKRLTPRAPQNRPTLAIGHGVA